MATMCSYWIYKIDRVDLNPKFETRIPKYIMLTDKISGNTYSVGPNQPPSVLYDQENTSLIYIDKSKQEKTINIYFSTENLSVSAITLNSWYYGNYFYDDNIEHCHDKFPYFESGQTFITSSITNEELIGFQVNLNEIDEEICILLNGNELPNATVKLYDSNFHKMEEMGTYTYDYVTVDDGTNINTRKMSKINFKIPSNYLENDLFLSLDWGEVRMPDD